MAAPPRISSLAPGAVLQSGRYTIERVLGEGGFGYVYLASDAKEKRQVAIKQCIDLDSETVRQFGHEFAVLKILAPLSSLFPQVYDEFSEQPQGAAHDDPKYVYGVMEFVPGRTLQAILDERMGRGQGPLGEAEVSAWTMQLLDALERAHHTNIIHRDIKPANIMLLPGETQIKLIDVGIAKIGKAGDKTQRGAAAASPGYAPFEQYTQSGGTDHGTDIYAVGATMYALLTGVVPLEAPARNNQQMQPPRQLNPQLSLLIESVILRAMEMKIADRFASVADMRAALQGKPVAITCPSCGQPNAVAARFCKKCGTSFQPGLTVAGRSISILAELPDACDRAWNEGVNLLIAGELRQWLQGLGSSGAPILAALSHIGSQYPNDPDLQLDALLRVLQPQRPQPQLQVSPHPPPPVTLEQGSSHIASFTITNTGRGFLAAGLATKEAWASVKPARVHCPPGKAQVVQVILDSANLSGTRSGRPYMAEVEVQTNAGRVTQLYQVNVTAPPHLTVSIDSVDFGAVQHGQQRAQRVIQLGNDGAGTLSAMIQSTAPWLQVAPASVTLAAGQSQPLALQLWSRNAESRGKQAAEIQIQAGPGCTTAVKVSVTIDGGFQLSCDPAAQLGDLADLVAWCDSHWRQAVQLLQSGELYAAARYIGPRVQGLLRHAPLGSPAALNKLQNVMASQDLDVALEMALRSLGAPPPDFEHNWPEVEVALGFGLRPNTQWFSHKRVSSTVMFRIRNCGRGYLHGCLQPLVPWLSIDYPDFGCLPRQEASIVIRVNPRLRRKGGLRIKLLDLQID